MTFDKFNGTLNGKKARGIVSKEYTDKVARRQRMMKAIELIAEAVRIAGVDEARKCFREVVAIEIGERKAKEQT